MELSIELNSPSKIAKFAELAAEMLGGGGKLYVTIQAPDASMARVAGPYLAWAGVYIEREVDTQYAIDAARRAVATPGPVSAPTETGLHPDPAAAVAGSGSAPWDAAGMPQNRPGAECDVDGVPYNPEVHAAQTGRTGGRTEDGRWKKRRGVPVADYEEWAARYAKPAVAAPAPAPVNPFAETPAPVPAAPASMAPAATVNPFANIAATPEPVFYDPGEAAVAAKATALVQAGKLTAGHVSELMTSLNVSDASAFVHDPAVRGRVWAYLNDLEVGVRQ